VLWHALVQGSAGLVSAVTLREGASAPPHSRRLPRVIPLSFPAPCTRARAHTHTHTQHTHTHTHASTGGMSVEVVQDGGTGRQAHAATLTHTNVHTHPSPNTTNHFQLQIHVDMQRVRERERACERERDSHARQTCSAAAAVKAHTSKAACYKREERGKIANETHWAILEHSCALAHSRSLSLHKCMHACIRTYIHALYVYAYIRHTCVLATIIRIHRLS
jgi:hypothetical protein